MSALVSASLDVTKIPKDKLISGKKGTYLNVTVSINNETSQYGDNASIYVSQTKEERDADQPRVYLGNGKVVWTDGSIHTADSQRPPQEEPVQVTDVEDDLPF